MFLVSGPELVIEACRAGVVGAFPSLNCRTSHDFRAWLELVQASLTPEDAPFAVNLIVHKSNARLDADLALTLEKRVTVVLTSIGDNPNVLAAFHGYGGLVFHDHISLAPPLHAPA